jgi:hypothetical protein
MIYLCFRHPDINANAYTAFGVLAFVIFLGVLGVVNGSVTFWIFFTGFQYIIPAVTINKLLYNIYGNSQILFSPLPEN